MGVAAVVFARNDSMNVTLVLVVLDVVACVYFMLARGMIAHLADTFLENAKYWNSFFIPASSPRTLMQTLPRLCLQAGRLCLNRRNTVHQVG